MTALENSEASFTKSQVTYQEQENAFNKQQDVNQLQAEKIYKQDIDLGFSSNVAKEGSGYTS
jgi:hypothetical protein